MVPVDGPATVLIDNCRPTVGSTVTAAEPVILFAVSTTGVDTAIRFAVLAVVRDLLDWLVG